MTEYNFLADLLSKYHTSNALVQMFWIIALIFLFWCIRDIFANFFKRKEGERENRKLIYTVYRDDDNKLKIYKHGDSMEKLTKEDILLLDNNDNNREK